MVCSLSVSLMFNARGSSTVLYASFGPINELLPYTVVTCLILFLGTQLSTLNLHKLYNNL